MPFTKMHKNGLAHLRASPCWHRNGLHHVDNVLAYGHRGRPIASILTSLLAYSH